MSAERLIELPYGEEDFFEDPLDDTEEDESQQERLKDFDWLAPEAAGNPEEFVVNPSEEASMAVIRLSEFVQLAFRMPRSDGEVGYENFSFEGRRHMFAPYDTNSKRILLVNARQTEKSTLLGNRAVAMSCLVPGYRTLYVSPTSTQTKTFSNDRIKEPIETSELLKSMMTNMIAQNVFEKQFNNWSKITLRNAFLNADRCRGIPAWMLVLDEFQDLLADTIPVIEQCTSHAPERWKQFVYAGTPKSLDNNIEYYRNGFAQGRPMSTQTEWMVPCDSCGSSAGAGRYWNLLGERNIGKKSLICDHCGKQIFPQHTDATWGSGAEDGIFESFRVPQLMVPWKAWDEIVLDYERYPRDKFYNEVLGLSYDSGTRPLKMSHVKDCCVEANSMHPDIIQQYLAGKTDNPIFAGIDHGTGENSYTVVCLGTYVAGKFRIFYIHRFIGSDLEPQIQIQKVLDLFKAYNVLIIGSDYGGGFYSNDTLVRTFGPHKVAKFQYMARTKKKVEFDVKLRRYKVFRTEVMSDIFNAIKRGNVFEFPRWAEFQQPYAADFCNIFAEYNETLRMLQYDHRPDRPDDSFHAVLYCFLASMIKFARPDVLTPLRQDMNRGPLTSGYNGPTNQY